MKKISIAIISFTLFSTFTVIGCGVSTNDTNNSEIIKSEKENPTVQKEETTGVNVNIGDNNKTLDVQVGSEKDGVGVKIGESGLDIKIGDKEGGISINLGSFLK